MQEDGTKISQAEIARMMVGHEVLGVQVYKPHEIGDVVLEIKDFCLGDCVRKMNFELRRGEILGITGLLGDGKEELVRAIFGDLQHTGGQIIKSGKEMKHKHPSQAKRAGLGYLPSNRKENAIIKDLSVQQNMTIVTLEECTNRPTLIRKKEQMIAEDYKKRLSIKVENFGNLITSLSGGNQQKVVLSKWLNAKPDVMILSNPTQGVDVGAKNEIYSLIMDLAQEGMSIIVTSGEVQEILKLCDRVLVMYHGELRGELDRHEISEESIMILSTGGTLD